MCCRTCRGKCRRKHRTCCWTCRRTRCKTYKMCLSFRLGWRLDSCLPRSWRCCVAPLRHLVLLVHLLWDDLVLQDSRTLHHQGELRTGGGQVVPSLQDESGPQLLLGDQRRHCRGRGTLQLWTGRISLHLHERPPRQALHSSKHHPLPLLPPSSAGVHDVVLFFCQSRSIWTQRTRPGSDWNVLCGDLLSWDRVCPTASAGSTSPERCCTVTEPRWAVPPSST